SEDLLGMRGNLHRVWRDTEIFYFFVRSARRTTKRRPDQVSSMAQTLLSTRPVSRPRPRTSASPRSVATPEDLLGQASQRPPSGSSRAGNPGRSRPSSFEL